MVKLSYSCYTGGGLLLKNNSLPELVMPVNCWDFVEVQDLGFPSCLVMICGTLCILVYSYSVFVLDIWARLLVICSKLLFCFSKIQMFRMKDDLIFITIWLHGLRLAHCLFKMSCGGKHGVAKEEVILNNPLLSKSPVLLSFKFKKNRNIFIYIYIINIYIYLHINVLYT